MAKRRIYLAQPMPHQLEVLRHPARNKVLACGRRWGKTKVGEIACIEGHGPKPGGHRGALDGGNIWWIAPTFPVASMIWRDLKKSLREGWAEKNENERRIVLPGGGAITVKSADNPDSLRGDGLDGAVLDEAAFMHKDAWTASIRPALSDKRGWSMHLTTPNGLNWFHELWQDVPHREGWMRWQRPTADNPIIDASEIAAARREVGPHLFAQEYEAQFLSTSGGLFKAEWFVHRYDRVGEHHYQLEGGPTLHRDSLLRFATVDLAASVKTTADYSVIASFGRAPDGRLLLLEVDRARREGPDLVPAISRALNRWELSVVWIEKVGFQLAIIQEARRAGIPVRELEADRDKVARALPATAALEGGQLLLPRTAPWLDELTSELLAFPNGAHDDQVDCISYGVRAQADMGRSILFDYGKYLAKLDDDDDDAWEGTGPLARRRRDGMYRFMEGMQVAPPDGFERFGRPRWRRI
jgi:predicted phage terminase large subunit-like protein